MTPANIEQLCAEHDCVDDMVAALEHKLQPVGTVRRGLTRAASVAMDS